MTPDGGAQDRVALIYSPHAGSVERAKPGRLLQKAGLMVFESVPIGDLGARDAADMTRRWRETGVRAVVAAGGDGSVGAVAALADQADLPLGILPLGTANDIARALALPESPDAAARLIASSLRDGQERLVDAGELVSDHGATGGLFMHALTLGVNVEFARLATDISQRLRWGKLTYAASAIESLSHFTPVPVTLTLGGIEGQPEDVSRTITAKVALLAAINLPVFGGRLGLTLPTIRDNDRLLDFFVIHALETPDLGAVVTAVEGLLVALTGGARAGQPKASAAPGWWWIRARSAAISTPVPVEITLDGELRGRTPAIARVAARPVRVLGARAYATLKDTLTTSRIGRASGTNA